MALSDSREAVGAVTQTLQTRLAARLGGVTVTVGRPEAAVSATTGRKVNLFLYRVGFDGHLRNVQLDEGRPAPLWLVLHYLITAYDLTGDSDSVEAHWLLSRGLAALQELNFVRPAAAEVALASNPEPLKVTFDEAEAELLSKLMQGADDHYRISAAFQVRPVLVAPDSTPSYSPVVLTVGPPGAPGVMVIPSMGARLDSVEPQRFEAGGAIELRGSGLSSTGTVTIGDWSVPATVVDDATLHVPIPEDVELSAGAHPIRASWTLASGRVATSNAVLGHLVPTVSGVNPDKPLTEVSGRLHGTLTVTGRRLGGPDDPVFVSFFRDGKVALVLEVSGAEPQTSLAVTVDADHALDAGAYRLILRLNGEQAIASPEVDWT